MDALSNIRAGEIPEQPSDGIPYPIWQLLEKSWRVDPWKRPSATDFYDNLCKFHSVRPGELLFEVQKIKTSPTKGLRSQCYVRFEYGNERHSTSEARRSGVLREYTWFVFRSSLPSLLSLSPRY